MGPVRGVGPEEAQGTEPTCGRALLALTPALERPAEEGRGRELPEGPDTWTRRALGAGERLWVGPSSGRAGWG